MNLLPLFPSPGKNIYSFLHFIILHEIIIAICHLQKIFEHTLSHIFSFTNQQIFLSLRISLRISFLMHIFLVFIWLICHLAATDTAAHSYLRPLLYFGFQITLIWFPSWLSLLSLTSYLPTSLGSVAFAVHAYLSDDLIQSHNFKVGPQVDHASLWPLLHRWTVHWLGLPGLSNKNGGQLVK